MRRSRGIWKLDFRLRAACVAALLAIAACRSRQPPQPQQIVIWKPIGTWSGRGNSSTNTFTSDAGGFRVHWQTRNGATPEAGRLRVVFHSADSGRDIIDAIDARGTGAGVEEVAAERPRWYYLTIESADVDWTITVDERIDAVKR
jgi:hypothetical protein